jgi:predicted GH43/DUF377 family glycosyl hydrolase
VGENDDLRRIATAVLDENFQIIPGSATPFSDHIEFALPDVLEDASRTWFADPRYFHLANRLWMMWNNGHVDGVNRQFLIEVTEDGLKPVGKAREILMTGARRKTEKNWSLFEDSHGIWAVYSMTPHRILHVDMSSDSVITCRLAAESNWTAKYSQIYGALRGGAQPIRVGSQFLNVVHSSYLMPEGREYVAAVYQFESQYPFEPVQELVTPIFVPDVLKKSEVENLHDLNPGTSRVVYPSGFVLRGDEVIMSVGINDHEMGIARTSLSLIQTESAPIKKVHTTTYEYNAPKPVQPKATTQRETAIPVFWWNAVGQVLSPLTRHMKFKHGNFGDEASPDIVSKLSGLKVRPVISGDNKLLAVGSILHRMSPGDVVWGSGIKAPDALDHIPVSDVEIVAVRGPLTLEALKRNGWDVSGITELFDPGILLAGLYAKELAAYDASRNDSFGPVRIIPHFRDELVLRRNHPDWASSFVTVDCHPLDMLKRLKGAEKVISSSLHGVIFAESLGIPAVWLASVGGEGSYKFLDYYASSGRTSVRACESLEEALSTEAPELPKIEFQKWLDTFPLESIKRLADQPPTPRDRVFPPANDEPNGLIELEWNENFSRNGEGLWLYGNKGSIVLPRLRVNDQTKSIVMAIRPRKMLHDPEAQNVEITCGDSKVSMHWDASDVSVRSITLSPTSAEWAAGVQIHIEHDGRQPHKTWRNRKPSLLRNLCIRKIDIEGA